MTNGEPLVVRGGAEADLDPDQAAALGRHRDQGAGAGAARAHRLDRGPGGRRRRRGDGRPGAGPLLPREVRRRPHRRRARRARGLPGADRVGGVSRGRRATGRAIVFIGFMGAGKIDARSRAARDAGLEAIETDELLEARARHADRRVLRAPTARRSSAPARPTLVGAAARERRRRRDRARRRQRALRAGPRGARPPRRRLARRSTPRRPGGGSRAATGRWRQDRGRFEAPARRARSRIYEALADAILPPGDRGDGRAGAARAARRCASCPPGRGWLWAASASGEYPVFVGAGLLERGLVAARGPALLRHRHDGRRRSTPSAVEPLAAARSRSSRASSAKTLAEAERVLRELARLGMTRADHVVALGGGVVGDLAGFCAATYQRGVAGRAGADHARRPGRLRLRRQDRGRPARGQELRRRLPPAGGGARRHRRRSRRCRRRSSRPASSRC